MDAINSSKKQILKERQNISKYTGLLRGRMVLLACLVLLFVPLSPVSIYLFAFFFVAPWAVSDIIAGKNSPQPLLLQSCAKKYHYTQAKFITEQCFGYFTVLLLAVWQITLKGSYLTALFRTAPTFVLLLYMVCRIAGTILTRRNIHNYYMTLDSLQNE